MDYRSKGWTIPPWPIRCSRQWQAIAGQVAIFGGLLGPESHPADLAVPRYSADIVETENDATITFLVVEPAFI